MRQALAAAAAGESTGSQYFDGFAPGDREFFKASYWESMTV
ncbi:MAG: hypothetical protein AAF609_14420 [Cyanobacteria bacterium P01_C01_bin.120]